MDLDIWPVETASLTNNGMWGKGVWGKPGT
jgi:hypothetical protein